jgi:ribonuclease BN (tRNA processing enzyme)
LQLETIQEKEMNILILGAHNRESLTARCTSFLIDGKLAVDAGGLSDGLTIAEQLSIKGILLSHIHYDHTRDIPNISMTFSSEISLFKHKVQLNIFTSEAVKEAILKHYMNGVIYGNFTERPAESPAVKINVIQPGKRADVAGYSVLPLTVDHRGVPTTAFEITDATGTTIFFTADTGPGLAEIWRQIGKPKLIISELTLDNSRADVAPRQGHLTPELLKKELISFREIKGYIPRVVLVHMNPELESNIRAETAQVAKELGASIEAGYEGLRLEI